MSVTFIDFFSGIGGFHSGFEKAGMKCVGWCEFDKYAQKSYREIYDTKGLYFSEDVRKIRGWELPNVTLWSFGFPCQDISIAGKQKGIGRGTRSGLFFEIMRLLDETEANKPEWIVCENVKNLLSIEGGGGDSSKSRLKWQNEGTLFNGEYTTQRTTEYRKTESEFILSDILEKEVAENYYLSQERVNELLNK